MLFPYYIFSHMFFLYLIKSQLLKVPFCPFPLQIICTQGYQIENDGVTVLARCILAAEAWTDFVRMCPAQAAMFVGLE